MVSTTFEQVSSSNLTGDIKELPDVTLTYYLARVQAV